MNTKYIRRRLSAMKFSFYGTYAFCNAIGLCVQGGGAN